MTYPASVIAGALELRAEGMSTGAIGLAINVPRRTVADWLAGRVPRKKPSRNGCQCCGGTVHDVGRLPDEYAYLLGLYLEDGSIASHRRSVYKLRINLDAKYPNIVEEAALAMARVLPKSKVCRYTRPYGDIEVYSYSKAWPCLFPQHGPGLKHQRAIVLSRWQFDIMTAKPELLLRGLIHSDGCRFMSTGRGLRSPRYSFRNRSADIREIFCLACGLLDLRWTRSGDLIYVSRKRDVARMDEFVGPKS